jgi:hypothetical protein
MGKASKGEVVVLYFEPLATQHMKASGSPDVLDRSSKSEAQRVKINEIKSTVIFYLLGIFLHFPNYYNLLLNIIQTSN